MASTEKLRELTAELLAAAAGAGPLLQRDYWAVIAGCRLRPRALMDEIARRFAEFAPVELVHFEHATCRARPLDASGDGLRIGDELCVDIRLAGECRVRVVSREPQSLTLATLPGHPEAGRITFGAYPNARGDVVFHIRSRARSSAPHLYFGFLTAGEAMQTNTWTDFVIAVAQTFGDGVIGAVHAETERIADETGDAAVVGCSPTFVATGDDGEPT
jgi:hypothetical protein